MQPLVIYFNERCLDNISETSQWQAVLKNLCNVIDEFFKLRSDAKIAFTSTHWQADCGGRPLSLRLKEAYLRDPKYGRDRYRLLLVKTKHLTEDTISLSSEIHLQGRSTQGLTLADAMQSWAFSLCLCDTAWTQTSIAAYRYALDDNGKFNDLTPCSINHLSDAPHVQHWATNIRDWGATVAASCVLGRVRGHPVVMYPGPKEHNPPHVHLLDQSSGRDLAKYRIDVFQREKGPPTLDAEMKLWVNQHRNELLLSWARCQQGGMPYEL